MPAPPIVREAEGAAVIVNALAAAVNVTLSTCVPLSEVTETAVSKEESNVAMSLTPLGGPPAVQLLEEFQSFVIGLDSHCALPAKVGLGAVRDTTANKVQIDPDLENSLAADRNNDGDDS